MMVVGLGKPRRGIDPLLVSRRWSQGHGPEAASSSTGAVKEAGGMTVAVARVVLVRRAKLSQKPTIVWQLNEITSFRSFPRCAASTVTSVMRRARFSWSPSGKMVLDVTVLQVAACVGWVGAVSKFARVHEGC